MEHMMQCNLEKFLEIPDNFLYFYIIFQHCAVFENPRTPIPMVPPSQLHLCYAAAANMNEHRMFRIGTPKFC